VCATPDERLHGLFAQVEYGEIMPIREEAAGNEAADISDADKAQPHGKDVRERWR
jgi:hypothetical protein